jgi:CRISPR type III-associated protein (TIGR04423 family)
MDKECVELKYLDIQKLESEWEQLRKSFTGEGYVWMSDKDRAELIGQQLKPFNEYHNINNNCHLNFIYEANLFDRNTNVSIFIQQVDSRWMYRVISLLKSPDEFNIKDQCNITVYKTTEGLKQKEFIKILEKWEPESDDLCEKMEVLKPAWNCFIGFSNNGGK